MAPKPTATPDGRKIRQLIWDSGDTVTAFACKVAIPRQSIWNICASSRPTGIDVIRAIARGLGVKTIVISDWDDDSKRKIRKLEANPEAAATPAA